MEPRKKINDIQKILFPGIAKVSDGSEAIVWIESHITQGGCFHPITPTEKMSNLFKENIQNGMKNLWDEEIVLLDSDTIRNSAFISEGYALAGGRITNFAGGPSLVSMKDEMFSIAGKRLPVVFNVGTRSLTSQSQCVYSSHDDVMAVNDCGWGMMFAKNVQEAADFDLIARKTAEESYTPFLNIQDGFFTTHKREEFKLPEPELMKQFIGEPKSKLINFFNPAQPIMTGANQLADSFMKGKIAQRDYYEKIPGILKSSMEDYYRLTGRKYNFVEGYNLDDANYGIVGLGSGIKQVIETCNWIRENMGVKIGALNISVFRPFPKLEIINALSNLKAFTVIERLDNPLAGDNPLTLEIKSAFTDMLIEKQSEYINYQIPNIYSCTYGLGGKELERNDVISIVKNMVNEGGKNYSIGVEHSHSIEEMHPNLIQW